MQALINIDYTNDFVALDGKLTAGQPAIDLEDKILQINQQFVDSGDFIVMAVDRHELNDNYHPEMKLFPPHNLAETPGRELFGKLAGFYQEHQDVIYWMDKRHYSAFSGTDLDVRLRERGITELTLVGVCTDICVLHTAVDAYNLGYQLTIVENAVASFNPVGHQWALDHFRNSLGAKVVKI